MPEDTTHTRALGLAGEPVGPCSAVLSGCNVGHAWPREVPREAPRERERLLPLLSVGGLVPHRFGCELPSCSRAMGGKKKQRKAKASGSGGRGSSAPARRQAQARPLAAVPEPEPEPEQLREAAARAAAQQQRRREWAIERTMRQLERRQRDPKPLVNELSDSLAAFSFLPAAAAAAAAAPSQPLVSPLASGAAAPTGVAAAGGASAAPPYPLAAPPAAPPGQQQQQQQQAYRDTSVFRWFLSLGHAARCATLTIHARQWVRTLLCAYRLHVHAASKTQKAPPLRFLVLPDLIPRSGGSVEEGVTYRRSSVSSPLPSTPSPPVPTHR